MVGGLGPAGPRRAKRALYVRWRALGPALPRVGLRAGNQHGRIAGGVVATASERQRGGSRQCLFVLGNQWRAAVHLQQRRIAIALSGRAGLLREVLFWQQLIESGNGGR